MADTYQPVSATQRQLYSDNIMLAVQQQRSRYAQAVTYLPNLKGKQMQAVELLGKHDAILDAPGNAPTPDFAKGHLGVHVRPRRIIDGFTIPSSTPILNAIDYQSDYMKQLAAAMVRGADGIRRDAVMGARLLTADASGTVSATAWAGRTVAVTEGGGGSDVGMNVAKLLKAQEHFLTDEIDIETEELWMAMSPLANTELYNDTKFVSKDYRDTAVLETKREGHVTLRGLLGVKFIIDTRLGLSSGDRVCPMWCKSGVHAGDAMPFTTSLDRDPSLQFQPRAFAEHWIGATRSEDEKVVRVLCNE